MEFNDRILDQLLRYEELLAAGQHITPETLCADCPELVAEVHARIQGLRGLNRLFATPTESEDPFPTRTKKERCHEELSPMSPVLEGFEFLRCLGRGDYGEVWLATDLNLQNERAVKLVPRASYTQAAVDLLIEESRKMAEDQHWSQIALTRSAAAPWFSSANSQLPRCDSVPTLERPDANPEITLVCPDKPT